MKPKQPWHHKEVLEAMYVLQGMTLEDMANIFGITVPGVAYWMNKFKIDRREHNIGDYTKGKKMSDEERQKLSEFFKARFRDKSKHPMFGKKHSEASKRKMSETKKRRRQERLGKKI